MQHPQISGFHLSVNNSTNKSSIIQPTTRLSSPQASRMWDLHLLLLKPNNQNFVNPTNSNQRDIKTAIMIKAKEPNKMSQDSCLLDSGSREYSVKARKGEAKLITWIAGAEARVSAALSFEIEICVVEAGQLFHGQIRRSCSWFSFQMSEQKSLLSLCRLSRNWWLHE